jgi:hypothetical protein
MQLIRMVATVEFQAAGFGMCFAGWQPFCHAIPFVQFMQQHNKVDPLIKTVFRDI